MSNELRIADETGLTYTCEVREIDGDIIGSAVSLTESGSSGRYYGDFPSGSALANTEYDLVYIQSSVIEATERRYWNGSKLLGPEDSITATGFSTHSAADVAAAVWAATTRTLTSAALSAADIWSYATRTLTSSPAQTNNAVSGATLTVTRGVTFSHAFTGTIATNWERVIFTVKDDDCKSDAQAVIQVLVTNPAAGSDGLQVLEGGSATASQASITVDQPGGTATLLIHDDATGQMLLRAVAAGGTYDTKLILDDSTSSIFASGSFAVASTPTWAY